MAHLRSHFERRDLLLGRQFRLWATWFGQLDHFQHANSGYKPQFQTLKAPIAFVKLLKFRMDS